MQISTGWEAITAIATSATVIVGLGAPIMIWLLTKPKVTLLRVSNARWTYDFRQNPIIANRTEFTGTSIIIEAEIVNRGSESTTIQVSFQSDDGKLFNLELEKTPIPLTGRGGVYKDTLRLFCPASSGLPRKGEEIRGQLKLEPWGNKRLLFGKKYLIETIVCRDDSRPDLNPWELIKNDRA